MYNEEDRRNLDPYEDPRDPRSESRNPSYSNNVNGGDQPYEQAESANYNQGPSDPRAHEQESFAYEQGRHAYTQDNTGQRYAQEQEFREPVYNTDSYQDNSGQYIPNPGDYSQYNQYSGQKQVIQQKPSQFLIWLNELLVWLKNFFSARPSSAVESAEYSKQTFPWAIFVGIFALVGAFRGLFNAIGAGRRAGYVVGRMFGFLLIAILVYLVNVLFVFVAKKLGGSLSNWYQAFNAGVVLTFPIFTGWVLLVITGSFFNPFMVFINGLIKLTVYVFTEVLLVQLLNKELKSRKTKDWWIFVAVLIHILLIYLLENILQITPNSLDSLENILQSLFY